ncbi:MAG: hypothetical protein QOI65_1739 [Thermoleophilaceae bacterium]|nr:hypothetical protein [Thermoleophilaceae bacterium]
MNGNATSRSLRRVALDGLLGVHHIASRLRAKPRPTGYFTWLDPRLEGIAYANWGSRPQEYRWAASSVDIRDKHVIDLGVGLPSQYGWARYAYDTLGPSRFHGIDFDERIRGEEVHEGGLTIEHGDMTSLGAGDDSYDVAFCLSVFEHLTIEQLERSCAEASRVLTRGGVLAVTLDEVWRLEGPAVDWNVLEQDAIAAGRFSRGERTFSLPDFLELVAPWFRPMAPAPAPRRDANRLLLHSMKWNSCVSYALLQHAA